MTTVDNEHLGRLDSGRDVWSTSPQWEREQLRREQQRQEHNGNHVDSDDGLDDYAARDDDPADDDSDQGESAENAIRYRMKVLRINREACRRLDDEERPPITLPAVRGLTTLLAEPDTPTRYRIDKLAPIDARIILSAQYKAGKTILVGNLLRSLVDGDPFLGRFTVNTPARHVVLIDDELSDNTLRPWLRDQNITNTGAVADVVALRGKVGTFNLLDERCRAAWVARLRDLGCDYLILDCLRPVLDSLGLDENRDAGRFLVAFDALLGEAGIPDACLLQHMGHANERARGDSRLQDWPDAIWRVMRETDEPGSARYFTAYGRDVDVPEGRLSYDPATRRLTYSQGSRHAAKVDEAGIAIITLLAECAKAGDDGLSGRAIEVALAGEQSRDTVREALRRALSADDAKRRIGVKTGGRNAKLHHLLYPCSECGLPVLTRDPRHKTCTRIVPGLFDE